MSPSDKIEKRHRSRQAYVYIRQSTPQQVVEHLESQALQYQLVQRAQRLGWTEGQIVVVDEDLGRSAVGSRQRSGFQRLVAAVSLNEVGIILVTDVSRLARNCADWYHLLDLASLCGVLLCDANGVYEPRHYDDRLLLGLKGAFSEAQWYTMRQQLCAAQMNKARRGELWLRLPVGYERLADGRVVMSADAEVQGSLRLLFSQFERLGSARAVLRYFLAGQLRLPRLRPTGRHTGQVVWEAPSYQAIYAILKQPAYAGAYAYGKLHREHLPGQQEKVAVRHLAREEWPVLIHDAYPAYITWELFERNQQQLAQNAQALPFGPSAAREGLALLSGIVYCGRCGRPMHARYHNRPAYLCDHDNLAYDGPRCQRCTVSHVDPAVTALFLQALQPAQLEAALAVLSEVAAERERLAGQWHKRLERAAYDVELARRRYEQVDPALRLVAGELERQWEEALQRQLALSVEWAAVQEEMLQPLSTEEQARIRRLAEDVPALWHAPTTTMAERKRLLRCLVRDVTLTTSPDRATTTIAIRWQTSTATTCQVERPQPGRALNRPLLARLAELAQRYPDEQVAAIMNKEGLPTANGLPWTRLRVRGVRAKHAIPTACPALSAGDTPRGDGLVKISQAARRFGATTSVVCDWFRRGLLVGRQPKKHSPLWLRLTEADIRRYDGSTGWQEGMVPLADAPAAFHLSPADFRQRVQDGRLLTYRIHHENRWRWYVQSATPIPLTPKSDSQ
jgi:DNA invertase Pin-like site-specific DNA recombinase